MPPQYDSNEPRARHDWNGSRSGPQSPGVLPADEGRAADWPEGDGLRPPEDELRDFDLGDGD